MLLRRMKQIMARFQREILQNDEDDILERCFIGGFLVNHLVTLADEKRFAYET